MSRLAVLAAALLMAGCSSAPLMPEVVKVPVATPCLEQIPPRPDLITDAQLKALDDYSLALSLAIDRKMRSLYEARLEAAVEGCWQPKGAGL